MWVNNLFIKFCKFKKIKTAFLQNFLILIFEILKHKANELGAMWTHTTPTSLSILLHLCSLWIMIFNAVAQFATNSAVIKLIIFFKEIAVSQSKKSEISFELSIASFAKLQSRCATGYLIILLTIGYWLSFPIVLNECYKISIWTAKHSVSLFTAFVWNILLFHWNRTPFYACTQYNKHTSPSQRV